ncbi:hypothetical protein, partial [Burkholderia multivorans]|uniref:hypothetical protein n=1 Tax=Burkholderia multivorans TaxID=87883 RepID=UPI002870692D
MFAAGSAATPTVQVERLQPSQIIVEGPSRRIIPGGPGRYQWFRGMDKVSANSYHKPCSYELRLAYYY